ncbi:MAG: deoxyhypusine synthase [Myxococcales bacterium]|nr:deoxyhypusine synthase [Myxococcales bacterium]
MNLHDFIQHHFRHFNAGVLSDAARGWCDLYSAGGGMLVTLGGAMSTAEIGRSLAPLIRQGVVSAVSCTGANLEEDLFNYVAHHKYRRVPNYRDLSPDDEVALLHEGLNRVTDTCIPESEAMRRIEHHLLQRWRRADLAGQRMFPHEFLYDLLLSGELEVSPAIDPADCWVLAAAEANLPLFVPGWEDSTLGNMFVAAVIRGDLSRHHLIRSGSEAMESLVHWYQEFTASRPLGFFQIGGGIAGDFPVCVVPLIRQDLRRDCPLWSYYCQISDSTTSYGSYSGAVPNEKITWGKLGVDTPRFVIESDATIVAPIIFEVVRSFAAGGAD